mgnify:FL=1
MKRIKIILLSILMLYSTNIYALEGNTIDFNSKGSIEITLNEKTDNEKIEGAEILLYKVADAKSENHNLMFEYIDELKSCDASLNDLETKSKSEEIEKCINENIKSLKQITDINGTVKYNDLDLGLYLVKQNNIVEGFSKIDSFLVMIPKIVNNKWIYDIKSTPKTDIIRVIDINVKKVWNTSTSNTNDSIKLPRSIEVELLLNDKVIDTVKLSKDNNWSYTWEDLAKSEEYTIKEINVPKGYTPSYQKDNNTFIVTNTSTLVQTGQMLWIVMLLIITGITFIIISIIYDRKTNEQNI